jgi:hypothetical protein
MYDLKNSITVKPAQNNQWSVVGEGVFSWSVFRFYRARLLSESGQFDPTKPYRLEIDYLRRLSASQIANVTGSEIKRLAMAGVKSCADISSETIDGWVQKLENFLPDVSLNDQLIGVFKPGEGVWFFDAQAQLGHIDDAAFVAAFTAIWLDPNTRATKLRVELLKSSHHLDIALGHSKS